MYVFVCLLFYLVTFIYVVICIQVQNVIDKIQPAGPLTRVCAWGRYSCLSAFLTAVGCGYSRTGGCSGWGNFI